MLHYGPTDGSRNGEKVLTYRDGLPGDTWKEPDPSDPMSVIDQVHMFNYRKELVKLAQ